MKLTQVTRERIENEQRLEPIVGVYEPIAGRLDERAGKLLSGEWLGHPLHPALTDLPIGCWTSSFVLDLVGGKRSRPASQRLLMLGIISAVPTAAAGLVDWNRMNGTAARRVGVVHGISNTTATLLYVLSWRARRRDRHLVGVMLGIVAATAASVGGYLGGHLAFGTSADNSDPGDVDHTAAPPRDDHALDGRIGG